MVHGMSMHGDHVPAPASEEPRAPATEAPGAGSQAIAWRSPPSASSDGVRPGYFHWGGPPGPGAALEPGLRNRLEGDVGGDLSDVRIHDGPVAAAMASRAGARAFTVGRDVVFGGGELDLHSSEGRELLVHEATHAAANSSGAMRGAIPVSRAGSESERHAEGVAKRASRGGSSDARKPMSSPASQGIAMLHRSPVKGNGFGDYDVVQTTHDGASATEMYWSNIGITFNPNAKTVDSSEIAFIQTVQKVDATGKTIESRKAWSSRETKDHSRIDALFRTGLVGYDEADKTYSAPLAGTTNSVPIVDPGSSPKPLKSAVTHDGPANNVPGAKFHFESAAFAKAGKDAGKVYGVIGWGFDVSDKNKVTAHSVSFSSTPGTSFTESVDAWNAQAAGPEADRMVKDQQKLGPLK